MNKVEMHKKICEELNDLYERKNADYGESFAELRKEYPESICIRLTDKLNRLKKLTSADHEQNVKDESVEDTLKDIANYAIMELVERKGTEDESILNDNIMLFYDEVTQHYFQANQKQINAALTSLSKMMETNGYVTISDYLRHIGLGEFDDDDTYNQLGWNEKWPACFGFSTSEGCLCGEPVVKIKVTYPYTLVNKWQKSVEHYGITGQKWGKRQKEYKSILIAFYNYDMNKHIQNLQLVYNNTIEEQYEYHSYDISGQSWKDQVFEMAKYIYTFLDGVYSDDHGGSMFVPDMLGRNALWIALDVIDHENHEIEYNMADPEEYDRITEFYKIYKKGSRNER